VIQPAPTIPTHERSSGSPDTDARVHVWSAWLDDVRPDAAALELLDGRERARAERFRAERDRDRYVARHAFLRRVLSGYLDEAPAAIEIRVTPAGRPSLDARWQLDISTSHDDGLAVIAVTRGGSVGIDVERVRPMDDALDLAESHLTTREQAWLAAHPAGPSRAFLELWTRKEAAVKALGTGLATPLRSFDSGDPDARGVSHPTGLAEDVALSIVLLDGFASHVGAVALQGESVTIHHVTRQEDAA
jgi:4'-phosphopantetheinyl transferase